MINKPFEEITRADIQALATEHVSEMKTMEFKRELPGGSDSEKREFLADVSSFANSSGGDLIFGIEELNSGAEQIVGVATDDVTAEIQRLESLVRDGIAPRVTVHSRHFAGFPNGPAIVMRIARSWNAPHMVTHGGHSRFFVRSSTGKHQMDVGQIRNAFVASEGISERLRRFRIERLSKIVSDETPVRLNDMPRIVLHLIPFSAFEFQVIEARRMHEKRLEFRPLRCDGSALTRHNVDGLLSAIRSRVLGSYDGYCQLFRTGIVEFVDSSIIAADSKIESWTFEQEIIAGTERCIACLSGFEVTLPIVVMTSVLGARGLELAPPPGRHKYDSTPIDRDELILPEIQIEEEDELVEMKLRPTFDALWNAAGWPESLFYGKDGKRRCWNDVNG